MINISLAHGGRSTQRQLCGVLTTVLAAMLIVFGATSTGVASAQAPALQSFTLGGCDEGHDVGNGYIAASGDYMTADQFISCYRKASIRRVFPSQYLSWTIGDISADKSAAGKRAWKLLNDNRFKK